MILVLTGLERFPFDRLLSMIDEALRRGLLAPPVFAQAGSAENVPRGFPTEGRVPPERLSRLIGEADLIITHAGVGSVVRSLHAGKPTIVVPRRRDLGEHVDDHQSEFANRMGKAGYVRVARTEEELFRLLAEAPPPAHPAPGEQPSKAREALVNFFRLLLDRRDAGRGDGVPPEATEEPES
jgi:UDP-N-acetylglucosamine transferase subunit ALG13